MMLHLLDHAGSASLAWASAMARACWQGALAFLLVWLVCRLPWLAPRVQCWFWRVAYLKLLIALFWATPVDLPVLAPSSAPNPAPAHPQTLLVRLLPGPHAAAASGARSGAAVARLPETGAIEIALTPAHRPAANRPPPPLLAACAVASGRSLVCRTGSARMVAGAAAAPRGSIGER